MAHEISMIRQSAGDMAWLSTEGTPWHGLGTPLPPNAPLEEWLVKAGMDYEVREAEVRFEAEGFVYLMPERKVLYRSDTYSPLSVVSDRYQVVQPRQVIEFYRELTEFMGFRMETAGVLKGGAMYWAMARVGDGYQVGSGDEVRPYLLLATSCDGTMSTVAHLTSVRVVCWNTLSLAVGANGAAAMIRVPHSTQFNPEQVKESLGLIPDWWQEFQGTTRALARRRVSREEAVRYFLDIVHPRRPDEQSDEVSIAQARRSMEALLGVYHDGIGQDTETARDTAWGLVCAVTRYADHERRSKSADSRLSQAWFGRGAEMKRRAWQMAVQML